MNLSFKFLLVSITLFLAACGGGGGGGGGGAGGGGASPFPSVPNVTQQQSNVVKAVIKPTALVTSQNVAAIGLSISLPNGVVPYLNKDGSVDLLKTLQLNSSSPKNYQLLDASYQAGKSINIVIGIATGFSTGDSLTINLVVSAGSFPTESDFRLLSFEAFDINGAAVSLNPVLSTTIQ